MRKSTAHAGLLFVILGLSDLQAGLPVSTDSLKYTSNDSASTWSVLKSAVSHVTRDHVQLWTSPLRLKRKDLPVWGAVLAGTAVLIACDEKIQWGVIDYRTDHPWVKKLSPHVSRIGDPETVIGVTGLFYFGGLIFKDVRAEQTGKLCLQAVLHTGIIVQVLKHLTGRQRPYVDDGKDAWHGPLEFYKRYQGHYGRYSAFPSGHSAGVWGIATVIARQYHERPIVPVLCYSLATLCSISRVTKNVHWSSDAFFGAVLGHAVGAYLVKSRSQNVTITPISTGRTVEIKCSFAL